MGMEAAARTLAVRRIRLADVGEVAIPEAGHGDNPAGSASDATKARAGVLRSQPGRRRCSSRTEFMLRSCQERARHVLLDRTLFSPSRRSRARPSLPIWRMGSWRRSTAAPSMPCWPPLRRGMTSPEPLAAHHQLVGFDCGVPDLNQWLQRRALANQQGGASRTWVLSEGGVVIAFNSLAPGSIVLGEVPGALRRNMPNPLPVVALGRLAVDRRHQGEGLGRALVAHAVARSLEAQQLIGVRALLVHALDDQAVAFYRQLGFRPSPISPTVLLLQLSR